MIQETEYQKQNITITIKNRIKCPICNSPILEVLRSWGDVEEYCSRWRIEKIKCHYFKVYHFSNTLANANPSEDLIRINRNKMDKIK